jgi:hypothetical protein
MSKNVAVVLANAKGRKETSVAMASGLDAGVEETGSTLTRRRDGYRASPRPDGTYRHDRVAVGSRHQFY